jgi:hypothetical protein
MDDPEPQHNQLFYTQEMRQFAENMWLGMFWFLAERNKLFTDVDLLTFCRKTLSKKNEYINNLAFIAGWLSALYHNSTAPAPPVNAPCMQLGCGNILLTEGRNFENGYFAGHDAFCKYCHQPADGDQNMPPPDTSDIHWVVLSVQRSDLDDRPLADKLFDAGMLVGYYLTGIRLSPHFSRVRLKENVIATPSPSPQM